MNQKTSTPAQTWRFCAGTLKVTDTLLSGPDDDFGSAFEREGYRCNSEHYGGEYQIWQKQHRFMFLISTTFECWTVEVEGLPDYLEFMTRYFMPMLHYEEMRAAAVKAHEGEWEAPDPSTITDEGWRLRLALWREKTGWVRRWGPPPDKPGCLMPRHIIDEAHTKAP